MYITLFFNKDFIYLYDRKRKHAQAGGGAERERDKRICTGHRAPQRARSQCLF